jgi:hypothetical protein
MTKPPRNVRYFEALMIISLAVGLIHQLVVTSGGLVAAIAVAAPLLTLTLLVSRRRQNWARWTLAGIFLLGLALTAIDMRSLFGMSYPLITIGVALLQTVGMALLFTRQSSDWFRREAPVADTFS